MSYVPERLRPYMDLPLPFPAEQLNNSICIRYHNVKLRIEHSLKRPNNLIIIIIIIMVVYYELTKRN